MADLATWALERWIAGGDLTFEESRALFSRIVDGEIDAVLTAGLLASLAAKGEVASEIAGAATILRERVVPIPTSRRNLVDTCGTGGDGMGTFNVSTAAAIVAAAAGVAVAKHGNRSVSSRSGSADVLEELGVVVDVEAERAGRTLDRVGLCFLFAPRLHPAMAQVMPVRRALGVRTIFNILGPLTNPAGARRQLLGVFDDRLVLEVAQVLADLGCDHGLVVRGRDGLDELTITAPSQIAEIRGDEIRTYTLEPEAVGVERGALDDLVGGSPRQNAEMMRQVLRGRRGALLEITALNAGAAIWVGGGATDLAGGVERARAALASGAALAKLEELRRSSGPQSDG